MKTFARFSASHLMFKNAFLLAVLSSVSFTEIAQSAIQFQNVTNSAGSFGSSESWGSAWGDFNGDGYPDLYFSKHRSFGGYYQNNGNGTFTNRTTQVDASSVWRNDPNGDTHGYTWADIDNDGDDDLFGAVSNDTKDAQLLLNNNNVFQLKSRERNLFNDGRGRMGLWFDYDNDGLLDVGIPHNGFYMYRQLSGNPGNFTQDNGTGVNCTNLHNYGQLIDTDNNGSLEFICIKEGTFPNKVYDMSTRPFTNVSGRFATLSNVNDTTIHDFNGDLRNDIVATRGRMRPNKAVLVNANRIEAWFDSGNNVKKSFKFKSNGALTFEPHSNIITSGSNIFLGASGTHPASKTFTVNPGGASGIKSSQTAQGIYIGFNTGTQEWHVTMQPGASMRGYFKFSTTVTASALTMTQVTGGDKALKPEILLNKPSGFVKDSNAGFINETCVSLTSGDFDNDTDVDIYMVCRHGPENLANVLYENQGNGKFIRVAGAGGAAGALGKGLASGAGVSEGVTAVDYNADGYLDLFVTNGLLMQPEDVGGNHQLFKNTGTGKNWVLLDLVGKGQGFTNRNGIGAKVYVTAGGKTQLREQNGGYHRWSQNHQRIHFGLGANNTSNVEVKWPSGFVSNFSNIAANKIYKVIEGGGIQVVTPGTGGGGTGQSTLSINDVSKTEGTGSTKVVVTLSPASTSQVKVRVKTSDGTATVGSDYNAKNVLLTFAPGVTTQNVWVRILNDGQSEADETINTTLSEVTNAVIGDGTGLVTIKDDDGGGGGGTGGLSTLSINDVTKTEGTGSAKVVVTLSPASTSEVKVRVKTSNGTATAGSDYNAKNVLLTFAPGATTKNVWVRILNDGLNEPDETINTTLSDVTNALIGDGTGLVTIKDDDGGGGTGGQSTLSINDVTKTEGTGSAKVVVTLSPASTSEVKVRVKTSNGTATAGSDYNAKNILLTFAPGVTTKNVWVRILNDGQSEADETINTTLSEVTNAVIGDGTGLVTIKDNDGGGGTGGGQSVLSINNVSKQEGTGSARLTLKLTPASTQQVKVNFVTVNGTAKSGSDYGFKSGTYTFDAGVTTKSLFIYIKPDTVTEGNESFTVKLSAPVNATIGDDTGIVTITE